MNARKRDVENINEKGIEKYYVIHFGNGLMGNNGPPFRLA